MITISTSEIVKKPRLISAPDDITLIEDARKHESRSVLLPYDPEKHRKKHAVKEIV